MTTLPGSELCREIRQPVPKRIAQTPAKLLRYSLDLNYRGITHGHAAIRSIRIGSAKRYTNQPAISATAVVPHTNRNPPKYCGVPEKSHARAVSSNGLTGLRSIDNDPDHD